MSVVTLSDRARIREALARDPELHLYELGDLDPRFWPFARFYGWEEGSELTAIALVYTASELPVLLALDREPERLAPLLAAIDLPAQIYAHLSPGVSVPGYAAEPHGAHLKMALRDRTDAPREGERLGPEHARELSAFYARAYPENWFDVRMLETGQFFGVRAHGEIVAAAGVHVFSALERVAALGNIATALHTRGRGLAQRVTAQLCRSLCEHVDRIGLNVRTENTAAIRCYERLGFVEIARYDEVLLTRRA